MSQCVMWRTVKGEHHEMEEEKMKKKKLEEVFECAYSHVECVSIELCRKKKGKRTG